MHMSETNWQRRFCVIGEKKNALLNRTCRRETGSMPEVGSSKKMMRESPISEMQTLDIRTKTIIIENAC